MHCFKTILTHVRSQQRKPVQLSLNCTTNRFSLRRRHLVTKSNEDCLEDIIANLSQGNNEIEKKLRILMLEVEVMRQDGRPAPDYLGSDHWEHLLESSSRNQRHNYLKYLWKCEKSKENEKLKKEARRKEFQDSEFEEVKEFPDDLLYGLKHQTLFLRIRDQSINNFDNYRALQALTYGQSLVIDCSYEDHMVKREILNAAKQLTFVFGDNRIHKEPFNLHLCNVSLEGQFMKQFRKYVPSVDEPMFPLNIHTQSYMDIFPKEKLVYLTPHCREELTSFDHDAIYIVGCMVDKMNSEPLSLAKAKRDGIKMAKLPLDRYLEWAPGSKKNLNINHMIPIMLDLKFTSDWEFSLRHIPRRKLMETKILAMQKRLADTSLAKEDILKSFSNLRINNKAMFKDKRFKSRKSLYDED
ncbi:mitochondrial ribonuclease P protein 1 homolog [Leptidea sinapis]|uniref:mitochondrial ribonuclease P protein 1 homolog n=1 Tax=Leptidea sinapis TaxID=189913 RepID=UPI0021288BF3|nr:mitochondrial ribonuclease P protein 1 homolog [Leptidea sinapis]